MAHADDYCPLDDDTAAMQLESLLVRTSGLTGCVLDLGCGDGRTAIPLACAGRTVLAIDSDPAALDALRRNIDRCDQPIRGDLVLIEDDLGALTPEQLDVHAPAPIQAAVCLGHTLMLLHDPLDALRLFRVVRDALSDTGWLAIDDFPHDLWYEVSEGNWQAGIAEVESEGGGPTELWQMVWEPGEPVIALRRDDEVDPDEVEILPTDRLLRLYSTGELRLLAACSGFQEPERSVEDALILFRCEAPPPADR